MAKKMMYTLELTEEEMYLLWGVLEIKAEDASVGDFDDGMLQANHTRGRTAPLLKKMYTATEMREVARVANVARQSPAAPAPTKREYRALELWVADTMGRARPPPMGGERPIGPPLTAKDAASAAHKLMVKKTF